MKTTTLTAVAIAVLVAAGGGYFLGQKQSHQPEAQPQPTERKVLYWYDPMMPGQRFDKPGKSPFMDMQLVPRYADEEKAAAGVGISAAATKSGHEDNESPVASDECPVLRFRHGING